MLPRHHPCPIVVIAIAITVAVSGCAVGPAYPRPEAQALGVVDAYANVVADAGAAEPTARWWTAFDDTALASLIEQALAQNTDLAAARGRLRSSRAALRGQAGARWPQLDAGLSASRRHADGDGRTAFDVGLDAAWELDLFGRLSHAVAAAGRDLAATQARLADVQRTVAAEVALAYVDVRSLQLQQRVARSNLALQDDTLQIARWREQAGLVSAVDVDLALAQRQQTAASVPSLADGVVAAMNRIALLTAQPLRAVERLLAVDAADDPDAADPDASDNGASNPDAARLLPIAPALPEAGVPAHLLQRRPDIAAAEHALAAEIARIGVAEAARYPSLRLSGSLGSGGDAFSDLGDDVVGSLLAGLAAPIFNGGTLRARVEQQRGAADVALANYAAAVRLAIAEVENALSSRQRSRERAQLLALAEQAAARALQTATHSYEAGLLDFTALLDAQGRLLSIQNGMTSARAAELTATIQLYKALGGGWTAAGADGTMP